MCCLSLTVRRFIVYGIFFLTGVVLLVTGCYYHIDPFRLVAKILIVFGVALILTSLPAMLAGQSKYVMFHNVMMVVVLCWETSSTVMMAWIHSQTTYDEKFNKSFIGLLSIICSTIVVQIICLIFACQMRCIMNDLEKNVETTASTSITTPLVASGNYSDSSTISV